MKHFAGDSGRMSHGNFEAASALANDIESSFGLKQEADRFREDISAKRAEIVRKQINDAAAVIDRHCRSEQWAQASREAERLAQLFPRRRTSPRPACRNRKNGARITNRVCCRHFRMPANAMTSTARSRSSNSSICT